MTRQSWNWIAENVVLAIHEAMIAEHGGLGGVRDESLLLSALARPKNLDAYDDPNVAELAAAYGAGVTRNHPFLDGNKRTGLAVVLTFLLDNGYELAASNEELVITMLALAEGTLPEPEFAQWIRNNIRPLKKE